jgi:alkylation response protein AidB-like acyl-CoA dehydrogenase
MSVGELRGPESFAVVGADHRGNRARTSVTDLFEHRKADFSADEDQQSLIDATRSYLGQAVDLATLHDPARTDFDAAIQAGLAKMGLFSLAVSIENGGEAGGLVPGCLVAEEIGWSLAPLAYAETVAASMLLDDVLRAGQIASAGAVEERLKAALDGSAVITVALAPISTGQLLPAGAVAGHGVFLDGDDLLLVTLSAERTQRIDVLGGLPVARWSQGPAPADAILLATGDHARQLHARAVARWRVLISAQLVGLTTRGLQRSVEFARHRQTRGVPIGSLQAIAHPLVDTHVALETTRNLVRKAAWYLDHEPDERPELPVEALASAIISSRDGTVVVVHVQGGQGVSLDSDVALVFTRVNALALLSGGADALDEEIGRLVFERHARSTTRGQ